MTHIYTTHTRPLCQSRLCKTDCAISRSALATRNFRCHINGRKYDRRQVYIFGVVLRLVQRCEIFHSDFVCLLTSYVIL